MFYGSPGGRLEGGVFPFTPPFLCSSTSRPVMVRVVVVTEYIATNVSLVREGPSPPPHPRSEAVPSEPPSRPVLLAPARPNRSGPPLVGLAGRRLIGDSSLLGPRSYHNSPGINILLPICTRMGISGDLLSPISILGAPIPYRGTRCG